MRKLPEHSPNQDLWNKIQQRKDFDSQVKMHAPNLPEKAPNADLWSAIEKELDQKTPVIPFWKYGMVAASIAIIFALSGIAYFELGEKEVETPLITEVVPSATQIEPSDKNLQTDIEPEIAKPEVSIPAIQKKDVSLKKSPPSEKIAPVELPKLVLEELTINNEFISGLIVPPSPQMEAPKTLHKVRISWGLEEQPKFRTTLGLGVPEDIPERQIGRANQKSNSIQIKIKRE